MTAWFFMRELFESLGFDCFQYSSVSCVTSAVGFLAKSILAIRNSGTGWALLQAELPPNGPIYLLATHLPPCGVPQYTCWYALAHYALCSPFVEWLLTFHVVFALFRTYFLQINAKMFVSMVSLRLFAHFVLCSPFVEWLLTFHAVFTLFQTQFVQVHLQGTKIEQYTSPAKFFQFILLSVPGMVLNLNH